MEPDELEDFVRANREEWQTEKPSEGHMARFQDMLDGADANNPGKPKSAVPWKWLAVAASLALLVTLGYQTFSGNEQVEPIADELIQEKPGLGEVSNELAEVEKYYQEAIVLKMASIKVPKEQIVIYEESQKRLRDLEENYESLKEDLLLSQTSDRVVAAMIQNYRLRLQILDALLQQLENIQKIKSQNDENFQA